MSSDNSSASTSNASSSPEPPASPTASINTSPPSPERLIQHFVSAKRSLSSTHYIWRANELVTNSRTLIEEIAVLNARNTFTGREIEDGVETLYGIREGISAAADEADDEFNATIEKLDRANERLEQTLGALRKTVVDASLQRRTGGSVTSEVENVDGDRQSTATDADEGEISALSEHTGDADAKDKTLYSFIDTTTHASLQSSLRTDIDTFNEARADLETTISNYSESLKTVTELLSDKLSGPAEKRTLYDEPPATFSALFHGMEDHAAEMAGLLGGLVRHYDLCVTALKHTEGGGEAAKRALQNTGNDQESPSRNGDGTGPMEEILHLTGQPEPLSPDEREEMLRVLSADAAEVDDVLAELRDRNLEQETLFSQLTSHAQKAHQRDHILREELTPMLHSMRDFHLPSHLHALRTFQSSWRRIQASIAAKTNSLLSLAASNESFLEAYKELLREVERRRTAEEVMRKVAAKARKELGRLHEVDRKARREFLEEFGPFLPQGIWMGAGEEGVGWEVREVGGG